MTQEKIARINELGPPPGVPGGFPPEFPEPAGAHLHPGAGRHHPQTAPPPRPQTAQKLSQIPRERNCPFFSGANASIIDTVRVCAFHRRGSRRLFRCGHTLRARIAVWHTYFGRQVCGVAARAAVHCRHGASLHACTRHGMGHGGLLRWTNACGPAVFGVCHSVRCSVGAVGAHGEFVERRRRFENPLHCLAKIGAPERQLS